MASTRSGSEADRRTRVACRDVPVPPTSHLSIEQLKGVACIACGGQLSESRVHRGVALDHDGGLLLDYDVYSCPAPGDTA
ncbi:hypothetical protein [Streptomyces sp. NPDC058674]|uniref:hypothetical protein n=1 Tax=Streptomyces sp. NPDC058674 TaxID=3346592 RepID=UPI00364B877F